MQQRSPKVVPLLPTAAAPSPPPAARQQAVLARHQRLRRLLLASLVVFCLLNAAWVGRAVVRSWWGRGRANQQAHSAGTSPPAAAAAARQQASSAADNAVMATMDAAAALSSAAGAVKHGAQAAGQAAGAALNAATPLAVGATDAAVKAAAAVGSAATAVSNQAAKAAANFLGNTTTAAGNAVPPAWEAKADSGQAGAGAKRLAELTPPVVAPASNDSCAQALGIRKVALMFLVRGPMQHEQAWRRWFASAGGLLPVNATQAAACDANADVQARRHESVVQACNLQQPVAAAAAASAAATVAQGAAGAALGALGAAAQMLGSAIEQQRLFSVYVHAPPEFEGYPPGSLFAGRLIPRRIPTGWGDISLVEATRNLLWEAFRDPLNERFVLLSESGIPLYDPLTLHQQLLAERKSRVNACWHTGRSEWRWSNFMKTEHMNARHWRKSTQWIGLTRPHAEAVLRDEEVYRSFEAGCWSNWVPSQGKWRDCFPDEHYFATLFAVLGLEAEMECDSWGVAEQDWSRGGAHPKSYSPKEVTLELVRQMRGGSCNAEAAIADAQRLYIDAAHVLGADSERSCRALQAAATAATAGYAHPLDAAACHVTARKFPNDTAAAVLRLFSPEVSCPRDGSVGLHMVSEHYCRQQQKQKLHGSLTKD